MASVDLHQLREPTPLMSESKALLTRVMRKHEAELRESRLLTLG